MPVTVLVASIAGSAMATLALSSLGFWLLTRHQRGKDEQERRLDNIDFRGYVGNKLLTGSPILSSLPPQRQIRSPEIGYAFTTDESVQGRPVSGTWRRQSLPARPPPVRVGLQPWR